jgi:cob(I)alamin adenosyltransferase
MAKSSVVVFTGDGKGKTEAALGLCVRALGAGLRVCFGQFIKSWEVSEDKALAELVKVFDGRLMVYKGGCGFYGAGEMSAKQVSEAEHKAAALETYEFLTECAQSTKYDLVIADEINNAVHDGLLSEHQLKEFIEDRDEKTHICLTGRNFPENLLPLVDYATDMAKLKHPYDSGKLAIVGVDY